MDEYKPNGIAVLIDDMVREYQEAMLEIVSLRCLLAGFMNDYDAEMMKMDILSGTIPYFTDTRIWEDFVKRIYKGRDPFQGSKYTELLKEYADGYRSDQHPSIYMPALYKAGYHVRTRDTQ